MTYQFNNQLSERIPVPIQTPESCLRGILLRHRLREPDGRTLYKYHLSKQEYYLLKSSLIAHHSQLESISVYYKYWAAAFCLYISEWYRRDYDRLWSWVECEKQLELSLTQSQREQIVISGIQNFWKRKIHRRGLAGRDLLGTLFFEGGLPWPLIKQEGNAFGNIIKQCLVDYYQLGHRGYSIIEIVNKQKESLPLIFQNEESLLLIVNIVDALRHVSENFDLSKEKSPYEFLTRAEPGWKDNFPLPLDDDTAQELINEWLIDAGKKKVIRTTQTNQINFSCIHYHTGQLSKLILKSIIQYPNEYSISFKKNDIQSTRLEMVLYEGIKPISHEGVVYGEIGQDSIKIRIKKNLSIVHRKQPSESLILKFLSAGIVAHQLVIPESIVDTEGLMVFSFKEEGEEQYKYISNYSCSVPGDTAIVRVPQEGTIDPVDFETIGVASDYFWVKISHDSTITLGDEQFYIRLSSMISMRDFVFSSKEVQLQTNPRVCYYGLPGTSFEMKDNYYGGALYINSEPLPKYDNNKFVGKNIITVVDKENHILLKKHIGIIPKDFSFCVTPKIHNTPASIEIHGVNDIRVNINTDGALVTRAANRFELQPNGSDEPDTINILMKGEKAQAPVIITLLYPKEGAILINDSNIPLSVTSLQLDKLLGLILLIHSTNEQEWIHLTLDLESKDIKRKYTICYRYECRNHSLQLSLFSLRSDILYLFSVIVDQDARVRMYIENSEARKLYSLDITRYEGDIAWGEDDFSIQDRTTHEILSGACPIAMNISDPKQKREITSKLTEGVNTGFFCINEFLRKNGPWLILPEQQSDVLFRPRIFINGARELKEQETADFQERHIESLHTAVKLFDGHDTETFLTIVSHMACDYDHSGWIYLKSLVEICPHIPLSSFEVWLAVAKNHQSLTTAIFRLDLNESICQKIQDELAILWDSISIHSWQHSCQLYREFLLDKGLSESIVHSIIKERMKSLSLVIPIFKEFASYIYEKQVQHNIEVDFMIKCLKGWGNSLRTDHKDEIFLEDLSKELLTWTEDHCQIKQLIDIFSEFPHYIKPTIYIPFFMAELTFGSSSLESLAIDEKKARFLIKRFIDFDRSWYTSVHGLILNYLLIKYENKENL